jgi:hypothetical protein
MKRRIKSTHSVGYCYAWLKMLDSPNNKEIGAFQANIRIYFRGTILDIIVEKLIKREQALR